MVRTAFDMPLRERRAFHLWRRATGRQGGEGVVTDVVAVDGAEECVDRSIWRTRQCDAAALTALVDDLALRREVRTAIGRPAVIRGRTEVWLACFFSSLDIALVDPGNDDMALAVDSEGVERVGDLRAG